MNDIKETGVWTYQYLAVHRQQLKDQGLRVLEVVGRRKMFHEMAIGVVKRQIGLLTFRCSLRLPRMLRSSSSFVDEV